MEETVVFLVGQMSDDDVTYSKEYTDQIRKYARLALIGLNNSVKKSNLEQLSDYSYILDLTKPIPDNIEKIFADASGCLQ